jgi:hypothetical protein
MRHGPPSWTLFRAGRLSATCPRLGFRPPPNNSCLGHHLPPRLGPPYPDASALRSACRVVDHRSVLLVSFCQDVMQVGRAKPACLSSSNYFTCSRTPHGLTTTPASLAGPGPQPKSVSTTQHCPGSVDYYAIPPGSSCMSR